MATSVLFLLVLSGLAVLIQARSNLLSFEDAFEGDGATCEGIRYFDVTTQYEKNSSNVCGDSIPSGAVALHNKPPLVFMEKCMLLISSTGKRVAIKALVGNSTKGVGVYDPNVAGGKIQNSNDVCAHKRQKNPPTDPSDRPTSHENGLTTDPPAKKHPGNTSSWLSDHWLYLVIPCIFILFAMVVIGLLWRRISGSSCTHPLRTSFSKLSGQQPTNPDVNPLPDCGGDAPYRKESEAMAEAVQEGREPTNPTQCSEKFKKSDGVEGNG